MTSELATTNGNREIALPAEQRPLSSAEIRAQVSLIQDVMKSVMHDKEHYGVIPGTGSKPSLLKPGAEKLCLTFRLDPQYQISETYSGDHLSITSTCTLYYSPTGQRLGSGMGMCSTRESKYAYRSATRRCPACAKEAIIKGKEEYGGGWVCFKKKDGCGAKFADGDPAIESQAVGRVANPDLPDQYNTVVKMANKRSLVAAVLNVTAASDIFTQDTEDMRTDDVHGRGTVDAPRSTSNNSQPEQQQPDPAERSKAETNANGWCNAFTAAATEANLKAQWDHSERFRGFLESQGYTDLLDKLVATKDQRKAAFAAAPPANSAPVTPSSNGAPPSPASKPKPKIPF